MTDKDAIAALTAKVMDAVSAAITAAVTKAVEEAYIAGGAATNRRVLAAIGGESNQVEPRPTIIVSSPSASDETGRRAPRGLTKEVVTHILRDKPDGLGLEEVQQTAMTYDHRLVAKTVYNELMRGRRDEYRYALGRWFLAANLPNVRVTDQLPATGEVKRMIS